MRMAIWHAGNTMSNIISGFLAAGVLTNMDNILGLHAWQWFFLIEGAASIAVAAAGYFLLPSWPHNTKWLTKEESEMAQYRTQVSNGGLIEENGGTWEGLKEAAKDPFTWLFCLMHFALVTGQSFKDFLPSVCPAPRPLYSSYTDFPTDYEDLSIRHADDLPRSSPPPTLSPTLLPAALLTPLDDFRSLLSTS